LDLTANASVWNSSGDDADDTVGDSAARDVENMSREERALPGDPGEAFERVWPRRFSLAQIRAWLGEEADDLVRDVVAGQVSAPLWELADRGGKRWRSIVGRLAYRAAGGAGEAPLVVFEIVELLHEASLVVDDIEDGADERRGAPSIHARFGLPVALNAANAAYFRALAALKPLLADETRLRALDMLAEELFAAHLGQGLDLALGAVAKGGAAIEEHHYRVLVRAKTGALIRIAARLAAIVAGATAEIERALAEWAGEVGVAYQIRDDAADLAEVGADLETGRLGHPVVCALARGSADDCEQIRRALGIPVGSEEERRERLRILDALGVLEESRAASCAAARRAVAALDPLAGGEGHDALVALTHQLAGT
jgi:geranylgeranyl diphosphate synthase, type I